MAKKKTGRATKKPSSPKPRGRAAKPRKSPRRAAPGPSLRTVGAERRAVRVRVAQDRAARYARFLRDIQGPAEPPGRATRSAAGRAPRQLRILAEGDSWFEYPLPLIGGDGVIVQLRKLLGIPILNMAHHGDEVRQMLSLPQRQEIIKRLSDPAVRFDALLFSGGGNDLAGDQFRLWLRIMPPSTPPAQLLNPTAVDAVLGVVETGYRELIRIRNQFSPQTVIFVHGYDFPPITGIGVCGLGPWLRPSLDSLFLEMGLNPPNPHEQFKVVRELLERFNAMLQRIAAEPAVQRFVVVPTQGTLVADKNDWQNEIHPTTTGFVKIAQKFKAALNAVFP
jgi:hypothetical protein